MKILNNACCFCSEYTCPEESDFHQEIGSALGLSTRIVVDSNNWFVIPSLGGLSVGHLLLIPKSHILCIANLSSSMFSELLDLKQHVMKNLKAHTGKGCICFEHGVTSEGITSPNSVNHLHLHMVPCHEVLWPIIARQSVINASLRFPNYQMLFAYLKHDKPTSYLLFQDVDESIHYIPNATGYPSQFFRIQLAKCFGLPEWDWRKSPNVDNIVRTIGLFR